MANRRNPSPAGTVQPNRFPGPCEICGIHVAARAGVCVRWNGGWSVRCGDHSPAAGAQPTAPADAAPAPTAEPVPAVSADAMQAASVLASSAMRDGNHAAARVAWEIVAAVAYCRGDHATARGAMACAGSLAADVPPPSTPVDTGTAMVAAPVASVLRIVPSATIAATDADAPAWDREDLAADDVHAPAEPTDDVAPSVLLHWHEGPVSFQPHTENTILSVAAFDRLLADLHAAAARDLPGGSYYKVKATIRWTRASGGADAIELRIDVNARASEGRTLAEVLDRRATFYRSDRGVSYARSLDLDPEETMIAYASACAAVLDASRPGSDAAPVAAAPAKRSTLRKLAPPRPAAPAAMPIGPTTPTPARAWHGLDVPTPTPAPAPAPKRAPKRDRWANRRKP